MRRAICCILPVVMAVALAAAVPAWSQTPSSSAGVVEGTGTHFEVTDSEYLNITLDSSELVTVSLTSVPDSITLSVEAAEGAAEAQLYWSGFEPDTEYHLYQDNFHNHFPFVTDASGGYTYVQDLTSPHLVIIQPDPSTIFLDSSGWSKPVGTWDPATKVATLTTDVSETIEVDASGITLDGSGHSSTQSTGSRGVFINGAGSGMSGITVKNLSVSGYGTGIDVNNASAITLSGDTISGCTTGVSLSNTTQSFISGNTISSCTTKQGNGIGIQVGNGCTGNLIAGNAIIKQRHRAQLHHRAR